MSSAAERYAASKRRAASRHTQSFAAGYDFVLDEFQLAACRALESGTNVLLAAPTGSGKTVVGEFAVYLAFQQGTRAFYTTPIKALSNQKYGEFLRRYGPENVGLLTGDNAINGDAPIVVMTTEVLRNMIYESSSALDHLTHVVLDEVHYLADRFRGAVWEEVLIQLASDVTIAALSATVSNAEEFGAWLGTVRGQTEVIVEEQRPVPLYQHVAVGHGLHDLFVKDAVNPALVRMAADEHRFLRQRRGKYPRRGPRIAGPRRVEMVAILEQAGLLPCITFIFSRAGCDAAAAQVAAHVSLTTTAESTEIVERTEAACAHLPAEDLALLGFDNFLDMLSRGVGVHHAGLLPTFKETVEDLFQRGLIKVVFATETLALGINMPAKSVVLEQLTKWNGETHAEITPGEYTQLTGRAGRRGIDVEGHAVVVWHQGFSPEALAGLVTTRTFPLRSSFHPSYNMAINLVERMGADQARRVLETSFAQFQADQAVVGLVSQIRRNEEAERGYREAMTCHLGDFASYAQIRSEINRREKAASSRAKQERAAGVAASLATLRRGDVVFISAGRRSLGSVVVHTDTTDGPLVKVLTVDRQVKTLTEAEVSTPLRSVGRLKIPKDFRMRSAHAKRDLALSLRSVLKNIEPPRRPAKHRRSDDAEITDLRHRLRRHPCHACNDREAHARWAERLWRSERETEKLHKRVAKRTNSIARQFDRVCRVLEQLGYLQQRDGHLQTTASSPYLARLYNPFDLLAAEAIRRGLWADLSPAELAAVASTLVFESRQDEPSAADMPTGRSARVYADLRSILEDLKHIERSESIAFLGDLDPGFAPAIYDWVQGESLEQVLSRAEMAAGDFVRWSKLLVDFCNQLAATGTEISPVAAQASRLITRGVVEYSSVG